MENIFEIQDYMGDFKILIHNELISEYFEHKRETRKPQNTKYKVLIVKGFIVKDEIKQLWIREELEYNDIA